MAEFLDMQNLLGELRVRLLNLSSLKDLKEFCPENVSKHQLETMLNSFTTENKTDILSQLRMISFWLNGSSTEFGREMNAWFANVFGSPWSTLIIKNTDRCQWTNFCKQRKCDGYEEGLAKFLNTTDIMDVEYSFLNDVKGGPLPPTSEPSSNRGFIVTILTCIIFWLLIMYLSFLSQSADISSPSTLFIWFVLFM